MEMDDEELLEMFEWVDQIPLSREKKNLARDFCDGLLVAEILKFYFPKFVELHNYPSASSSKQKLSNWNTLKLKVFKKIKFPITQEEINDIISVKPKAIEKILIRLYNLIVKKNVNPVKKKEETIPIDIHSREKLQKEIETANQDIDKLLIQKENLERMIGEREEENKALQRQIEDALAQLEAKKASEPEKPPEVENPDSKSKAKNTGKNNPKKKTKK